MNDNLLALVASLPIKSRRIRATRVLLAAAVMGLAGFPATGAAQPADKMPNEVCLSCHGNEGFGMPGPDGKMRALHVIKDRFDQSVHGKRMCVECHKDITAVPHQKGVLKVSCVTCHEDLWAAAKKEGKTQEFARLGVVVDQIEHYMKSIHARPNREDQSRTNATCYNCHDAHYVYPPGSAARADWRLGIPNVCGKCHSAQRTEYLDSVHGRLVMGAGNPAAPVCSDCHTTHDVDRPKLDRIKLVIGKNCGNCHAGNLQSYANTYHGQVTTLGYTYAASCFDCHGNHDIQRVSHPRSTVHSGNRLQTCQKCHASATAGFVTFQPHANTHDFARYPYMWMASKFMIALLAGVFAFFWTHSLLWFYREYRDRREGRSVPHVALAGLPQAQDRHFNRFGPVWRLAHLVFALSVMMLVLTGMAVLYAETGWAKFIMGALGGPRVAAFLHRVSAFLLLGIFFLHLVYMAVAVAPKWKKLSDWFGPDSLVPNWRDLADILAMFRWFVGKGPRPAFGRWTYWEKFDYWAVFWGMAMIGGSGMMLAFKETTASVLPGWVFNVATLVHGEEAILAAVFLFTVHFFNNHFRPDKMPPPDIVMFTGTVALDHYRQEHALEYQRLVESGELAKHLVDVPSPAMTLGSKILGLALLAFGLSLLALVLIGFLGQL